MTDNPATLVAACADVAEQLQVLAGSNGVVAVHDHEPRERADSGAVVTVSAAAIEADCYWLNVRVYVSSKLPADVQQILLYNTAEAVYECLDSRFGPSSWTFDAADEAVSALVATSSCRVGRIF